MSQAPFVFVFGASRSGTTLVRAMLDSHSQLAMPIDNRALIRCMVERGLATKGPFDKTPSWLDEVMDLWELPVEQVDGLLASSPAPSHSELLQCFFSAYASSRGKTRFGYKMPAYARHIAAFAELFPTARFIHVIRDGRSVAAALAEIDFGPDRVDEAAFEWSRTVRSGRAAGRRLGPGRYREFRYESFVGDAEGTLRDLCTFVDLEYEDSMVRYYESTEALVAEGTSHRHRGIVLPPTPSLRDFSKDLDPREIATVESLIGSLLDDLGYGRVSASSPRTQLGAIVLRARLQSRRGARAIRRLVSGKRARWPYGSKESNEFLR